MNPVHVNVQNQSKCSVLIGVVMAETEPIKAIM